MSISISGNGSFTGANVDYSFDQSVGIAGTLTYEDVTSVDSVGIITAQSGIVVTATNSDTPRINFKSTVNDIDAAVSTFSDSIGIYAAFGANYKYDVAGNGAVLDTNAKSSFVQVDGRNHGAVMFGTASTGLAIERMRLDSAGRLMIGTATPGTTAADNLTLSTSGDTGITIRSGASDKSIIMFANGINGSENYRSEVSYDHAINIMSFTTGGGFERMRLDNSGRLLVGATAAYGSDDTLVIQKSDGGARIGLQRQDSGQVTDGAELGAISFYNNDGDLNPSARITGLANGAQGVGDKPGCLTFLTTPASSATPTERMRIDSAGNILINTTTTKARGINNGYTSQALSGVDGGTIVNLSDTRHVAAVNNSTVDAWVGTNGGGNPYSLSMVGYFYIQVGGANSYQAIYRCITVSLGTNGASFTEVHSVTRGTSPVSSVAIANDGSGGAIKLQITYIDNSSVVSPLTSTVAFLGLAG